MTGVDQQQPKSFFTERLVDQFFGRWFVLLLPVVLFGALGVYVASEQTSDFVAEGSLSASSNPLVAQPEVRGTEIGAFESPAAGTARLINEQLGTDAFLDDVAGRSGLGALIESGVLERDDLRRQLVSYAEGENILTVQARWPDGQTAFQLVDSTIATYLDYVTDVVTTDSLDAIDFFERRLETLETELTTAEAELDAYIANLPSGTNADTLATEDSLIIDRLIDDVSRAAGGVAAAQDEIDSAMLASREIERDAFQQLRVVDEPTVPEEPESLLTSQITSILMFTVLGLLVAFCALLGFTALDRSIRSSRQLAAVVGTDVAAVIPNAKIKRSRRSSTAANTKAA